MATTFTGFGDVPGQERIYGEKNSGARVFLASDFYGYNETAGDIQPQWNNIIRSMMDSWDQRFQANLNLPSLRFEKSATLDSLESEIEWIETGDQAEGVIEFLATETEIDGKVYSQVFQLSTKYIEPFPYELGECVQSQDYDSIFTGYLLVDHIQTRIDDYLEVTHDIENILDDLSTQFEDDLKADYEEIKSKLKSLGEDNDTIPEMEELTGEEKDMAIRLAHRAEFYKNSIDSYPDVSSDSINYYESRIDDFQEWVRSLRSMTADTKTNTSHLAEALYREEMDESDFDIDSIQSDLEEVLSEYSNITDDMDQLETIAREYENDRKGIGERYP